MYGLLLFIFVINTFFLMIVILMQSDKSGGLSSTFGGVSGAASSTFGTRETVSFLHKMTVTLTVSFFVLAIVIGLISKAEFNKASAVDRSLILQRRAESPAANLPLAGQPVTLPVEIQPSEAAPEAEIVPLPATDIGSETE